MFVRRRWLANVVEIHTCVMESNVGTEPRLMWAMTGCDVTLNVVRALPNAFDSEVASVELKFRAWFDDKIRPTERIRRKPV